MYDSNALNQFEERLAEQARRHIRRQAAIAQASGEADALPPDFSRQVEKQLRRERMKARSGHAAYDFNRHLALLQLARRLPQQGEDAQARSPSTEKAGG